MTPLIHAAWIDLSTLGFVAAAGSLRWLARTQSHANASAALDVANEGRSAILAKTCEESEAGWAELVREALRLEPVEIEAGYRDAAAALAPSPALAAIHRRELARLRVGVAVGLAGAMGMLIGATVMADTIDLEVLGAFIALVAVALAWRVIVRGLRSQAVLATTFAALPAIVSHLDAAPPERALDMSMLPILFTSARWFGVLLAFPASIGLALLASDITGVINATNARMHVFAFFFFSPLWGAVLFLLATTRIQATRSDLIITRRALGIPYARMHVPLEIVRGFSIRAHARESATALVVTLLPMAAEVEIYVGYGAKKAADDLNRLL